MPFFNEKVRKNSEIIHIFFRITIKIENHVSIGVNFGNWSKKVKPLKLSKLAQKLQIKTSTLMRKFIFPNSNRRSSSLPPLQEQLAALFCLHWEYKIFHIKLIKICSLYLRLRSGQLQLIFDLFLWTVGGLVPPRKPNLLYCSLHRKIRKWAGFFFEGLDLLVLIPFVGDCSHHLSLHYESVHYADEQPILVGSNRIEGVASRLWSIL